MRCAIYTRKSTDEGLEQSFNSLDAQREACEAYIASQKHEGWICHDNSYDDGGWSGGTIERPALRKLMGDIKAGMIKTIVVYKIDRLTRSLTDFAKLVEIFDEHGVTFVSVTQQFNTTTSMGRLTLNVLLSFAQYEREITGERIRDKFAASKAKGMFMGGKVPIGYLLGDRELLIDDKYAEVVNLIFEQYLELGSAGAVKRWLNNQGILTPVRHHRNGRQTGGKPFYTGHLYQLLSNPIYIGKVRHKQDIYDGQHAAIISQDLWDSVQARLAENASRPKGSASTKLQQYPLVGKIFSSVGYRLAPTTVHKKETRYRHYTVNRTRHEPPYGELTSLPAQEAERVTAMAIKELLSTLEPQQSSLPAEVFLQTRAEVSGLPLHDLTGTVVLYCDKLDVTLAEVSSAKLGLSKPPSYSQPIAPRSVGKRNRLILTSDQQPRPNTELILAVAAAWEWYKKLTKRQVPSLGELAEQEGITQGTIARNLPLALLKPEQVDKLLTGKHHPDLTIKMLLKDPAIL